MTRLRPGASVSAEGGLTATVRAWRGEGSYARVYQGVTSTGGACAVKLAKADIPEAVSRLGSEQRLLAQLGHPQIVKLLGAGTLQSAPFLLLEWLDGETLRDLVHTRRRLALRQSLEILEAMALGLEHVHARGLVHGDLRAENVIIVPGRCAVLTDPGGDGTTEDDVRALGALLHCMLTGSPPDLTDRLTAGAGYNRGTVHLWEQLRSDRPPSAAALLTEVRRLRRAI